MDQIDQWQVVPRQVFTPNECLLISLAFVVPCSVGCLCNQCNYVIVPEHLLKHYHSQHIFLNIILIYLQIFKE